MGERLETTAHKLAAMERELGHKALVCETIVGRSFYLAVSNLALMGANVIYNVCDLTHNDNNNEG